MKNELFIRNYLSFIYQPWSSRCLAWCGMAEYVSGVLGSGVLRRYDFHDHCVWNDFVQLAK